MVARHRVDGLDRRGRQACRAALATALAAAALALIGAGPEPAAAALAVGGIVPFRKADPGGGAGAPARADGPGGASLDDTVERPRPPAPAVVPDLLISLHIELTRGGLAGRSFFGHFACRKRDLVARMRLERGTHVASVTTLQLAIGARLYRAQDFAGFAGSAGLELIRTRSGALQMAGRTRDRRLALLPRDEGTAVLVFDPEGNITSTGKAHVTASVLVAEPHTA